MHGRSRFIRNTTRWKPEATIRCEAYPDGFSETVQPCALLQCHPNMIFLKNTAPKATTRSGADPHANLKPSVLERTGCELEATIPSLQAICGHHTLQAHPYTPSAPTDMFCFSNHYLLFPARLSCNPTAFFESGVIAAARFSPKLNSRKLCQQFENGT